MSHPRITITKTDSSDIDKPAVVRTLGLNTFVFPGGEVSVKLDTTTHEALRYMVDDESPYQLVSARIQSASDLVTLMLVVDALRRFEGRTPIRLFLPYVPAGRQDRVCVDGESFSLLVYARALAALGVERITTVDPHSEVTAAVFDSLGTSLVVIPQRQVIAMFDALNKRLLTEGTRFVLVSPDAGANKKTSSLAAYFGQPDFLRADKKRNLATGEIVETVVYGDPDGRDAVIVDDLGDGCRTFTELAKVLKTKGAPKVILYVTHGLFSKGLAPLFDAGIDEVYTSDSFHTKAELDTLGAAAKEGHFHVVELERVFSI